nr:hypothetical protein [uncultured Draconibacterium sp.]
MKKTALLFLASIMLASCAPKLVGTLNMISVRNVDSNANYELLSTGTSDSRKAAKQNKGRNIDEAIQNAVADVPGGEFLKNAKLYTAGSKYMIVGDVWGIADNANVEGFRVGDVVYKKNSLLKNGTMGERFEKVTITGFKDRQTCLVKNDKGEIIEVDYSKLSKTGE